MYEDILTVIKSIFGLLQAEKVWFKECIMTMNLKEWLKKWKTDTCCLYRVNNHRTTIVIVYVYYMLEIGDKPALMDTIQCIKKQYVTW